MNYICNNELNLQIIIIMNYFCNNELYLQIIIIMNYFCNNELFLQIIIFNILKSISFYFIIASKKPNVLEGISDIIIKFFL